MDFKDNDADKLELLKKLSRDICVLNAHQKRQLEELLVEYIDVFVEKLFDVSYNTELKIILKLEHPGPVYLQVH